MRTNFRLMAAAFSMSVAALVTSCKQETQVEPQEEGKVEAAATVAFGACGKDVTIGDRVLTASNTYILRGIIRIQPGATLTIEPGTLILGECGGTIVIERGARIIAQGTPSAPIRFSSNKPVGSRRPGDWGGLIVLGDAPVNKVNPSIEGVNSATAATTANPTPGQYGGTNPNHDGGIISYVRIEYPGTELGEGNEINGLTMGGVGRGTQLDHVQVLYTQDDGFEWFGGNVDAKYLYAFGVSDDDFDTDFGYTGRIQFAAGVKTISSEPGTGASNGFESDNDATGSTDVPRTNPTFANVTLSGPCGDDAAVFGQAMLIRRNSQLDLYNSVISEWGKAQNLCTSDQPNSIITRVSYDSPNPGDCPEGLSFLANVLPGDCPRPSGNSATNLTRNPDLGSTTTLSDPFFTSTTYRGAFSSVRANNNGWDLPSENPSFTWLSFKPFGN